MDFDPYWDFIEKPNYYEYRNDKVTRFMVRNPTTNIAVFLDEGEKAYIYDPYILEPCDYMFLNEYNTYNPLSFYIDFWENYKECTTFDVATEWDYDPNHFRLVNDRMYTRNWLTRTYDDKTVNRIIDRKTCKMVFNMDPSIKFSLERYQSIIDKGYKFVSNFARNAFYNVIVYPKMTPREFLKRYHI